MKSISQINQEKDTCSLISAFAKLIGLADLSKKVNFKRHSLVSLLMVINWMIQSRFARKSLYRFDQPAEFTSKTGRNVLNDGRINWQKLLCLAAVNLITALKPAIDKRRRLALIVDDTLMSRSYSKKTELLARVYDHNEHEYVNGYRGLTVGWSDGNTFLPVNFALMSTKNKQNMIGSKAITTDKRSIAGRRRNQAQRQMNDVTVELIKQALNEGIPADYVLFDSWFASPKMFWRLKQLGLNSVSMLKLSKKVYYRYRGRLYDVKSLYERLTASKIKLKDDYLYSCVVEAEYQGHSFPLRLVYVTKRGNKRKYLVLATTRYQLQPKEIIQLYGRRWQIETFFKATKQYLALDKSQIQNYDGQSGYFAITALTYELLAWQERQAVDERTIGDLFYLMNDALPDLAFEKALVYLLSALKEVKEQITEEVDQIISKFIKLLPSFIQKYLA
ncbi:transposase [Lactobacillus sp. ESL0791]|uniref:IS4 family transposase n=1 Tax=Lactobacillus sp. ESL0791 TaxID=2983234 RepID=UPI0023F7351E|nr:transposase [Lactobacillus sp. ESL0791]MDF7639585.1 transposase [Lactobacillus sp. ESL0791]MDF7639603.1 transposase [Lactobacillus sp. ESL0791]